MLREGVDGFCMALADSVPGVSGGTVAFIMGFYDQFIGSIHDLVFGKQEEKKAALLYLAKLGVGWAVGMLLAVAILSALFERHIYAVSSLFFGLVLGAVPLVIKEELGCLRKTPRGAVFALLGLAAVVGITMVNGRTGAAAMDLDRFSILLAVRLFFIGMAAISAMFLPGISGSTLLLIFGAYIPVIMAVKQVLSFHFSPIPCLLFFGCGILAGVVTVVKAIKVCLERYRSQTVYLILGMMIGSLYAIGMGPTTLEIPQAPLDSSNLSFTLAIIGTALVFGMQMIKER